MNSITTRHFLDAFAREWQERLLGQNERVRQAWSSPRRSRWTQLMLSDDGILQGVARKLQEFVRNLTYKQQWYTVDALYVGGDDLYRNHLTYPSEVHVLIEHENDDSLETEMWKLLFWRAPLKVLIFYDWPEAAKLRSSDRANWLEKKLRRLREMRRLVDKFHGESATEYLFLIGQSDAHGDIAWAYATHEPSKPTLLPVTAA